ncbi:alr0857 family protein [[Limnothrix rosea] IAM M-220]|uniref:alr0857 family protein n=1 Tax=[Limnothrix rosea] IAM M-220 TaxID=454133 RepID=UPI00095D08A0|nr:alr0857 family protein [[Limnothrix rosea] IAM M-220]OKH19035.1 hypothetical protein NIES208_03440 [[Limnothrix rosea] IAM M-220]
MLKLIYTDESFRLERLTQSVETWIRDRAVLALRTTQNFYLEPSSAAFLVLKDLPLLAELVEIKGDCDDILDIAVCDAEYSEVSLKGHWVTNDEGDCSGTFICKLGDRPELLLEKVWQASQNSAPVREE